MSDAVYSLSRGRSEIVCYWTFGNENEVGSVHLYNRAAVSLGVINVEWDEILSLDASAVLVINSHVLSFEAQLEQTALGDGHLHLSVLAGHLGLDDVIFIYNIT